MTAVAQPETYQDNLGALICAYRMFTGMDQRTFAAACDDLNPLTLSRIETGKVDCPPGFLSTVQKVVVDFQTEVTAMKAKAEEMADETDDPWQIHMDITALTPWERAVVARAAVITELILPILDGRVGGN